MVLNKKITLLKFTICTFVVYLHHDILILETKENSELNIYTRRKSIK